MAAGALPGNVATLPADEAAAFPSQLVTRTFLWWYLGLVWRRSLTKVALDVLYSLTQVLLTLQNVVEGCQLLVYQ